VCLPQRNCTVCRLPPLAAGLYALSVTYDNVTSSAPLALTVNGTAV
jgi:hypothetical protein